MLYDSRALDAIVEHTADTADAVARLEQLLKSVFELREEAADPLAGYVMDVERLCKERTLNFVGRHFLLDEIDRHLGAADFPNGYLVLRGEPGIGKTALMAYLVLNRGYAHHFNIVTSGVVAPDQFLGNICAQLIVRYELPFHELPLPRATRDSVFFGELLDQVASLARSRGELPIVIAIDALDEADRSNPGNVLLLPTDLPDGIYILATTRPLEYDRLSVERRRVIDIAENDPANLDDIRTYITNEVSGRYAASWTDRLNAWNKTASELIEKLVQQSEGNFMYVKYILGDLRNERLSLNDLEQLTRLPDRLHGYYNLHWNTMQSQVGKKRFRRCHSHVLGQLAVSPEPATPDQLLESVNGGRTKGNTLTLDDVTEVLREWLEFLDEEHSDPPTFRIYHSSFRDFLARTINLNQRRKSFVDAALAKSVVTPTAE